MMALAREISRNLLLTYWLDDVSYSFICILLRNWLSLYGCNILISLEYRAGSSTLCILAPTWAQHRWVHWCLNYRVVIWLKVIKFLCVGMWKSISTRVSILIQAWLAIAGDLRKFHSLLSAETALGKALRIGCLGNGHIRLVDNCIWIGIGFVHLLD